MRLAELGELAGYEVHDRFYEIGSPDSLAETEAFLRSRRGGCPIESPREPEGGSADAARAQNRYTDD
jgi:NDP-sugar pyrophosphorylase family protein